MFDINNYRNKDKISINKKKVNQVLTESNTKYMKIPIKYEYRPDLIAYNLYNDVTFSTFLAIINEIDNSPEGFKSGKVIKYLDPEYKSLI